jgi:hypothetical protein
MFLVCFLTCIVCVCTVPYRTHMLALFGDPGITTHGRSQIATYHDVEAPCPPPYIGVQHYATVNIPWVFSLEHFWWTCTVWSSNNLAPFLTLHYWVCVREYLLVLFNGS